MANEQHARSSLQASIEVGAAFLAGGTKEIARLDAENEQLRRRVLQLENEIVTHLQGDLAILAESYTLDANGLRSEAFVRYQAAVGRWREISPTVE